MLISTSLLRLVRFDIVAREGGWSGGRGDPKGDTYGAVPVLTLGGRRGPGGGPPGGGRGVERGACRGKERGVGRGKCKGACRGKCKGACRDVGRGKCKGACRGVGREGGFIGDRMGD